MKIEEIDNLYMEVLGRHVDSCGLEAYKDEPLEYVKEKLIASPEYADKMLRKQKCDDAVKKFSKPTYMRKNNESLFDVVICRYNEDLDVIDEFACYPCTVYIYNKGNKINREFKGSVKVIDCLNIGFEDYVYLKHLFIGIDRPTLFMQCGIDHSPGIFSFLDSFEYFSGFESLSQGVGERDPRPETYLHTNYGVLYDIDVTKFNFDDILMIFSKSFDVKEFFKERYEVTLKSRYFSPGAFFFIRPENIDKSVKFDVILDDVEYCYTLGSYMSKKLASVFERYLWTNIVIETKK